MDTLIREHIFCKFAVWLAPRGWKGKSQQKQSQKDSYKMLQGNMSLFRRVTLTLVESNVTCQKWRKLRDMVAPVGCSLNKPQIIGTIEKLSYSHALMESHTYTHTHA